MATSFIPKISAFNGPFTLHRRPVSNLPQGVTDQLQLAVKTGRHEPHAPSVAMPKVMQDAQFDADRNNVGAQQNRALRNAQFGVGADAFGAWFERRLERGNIF